MNGSDSSTCDIIHETHFRRRDETKIANDSAISSMGEIDVGRFA